MPSPVVVHIPARTFDKLIAEIEKLIQWLRPSKVAMKVGRIKSALAPAYMEFSEQAEKLIDELVQTETVDGVKKRKRRPHANYPQIPVWDFGENEEEFNRRDKELRDSKIEVTLTSLLTEADMEKIEKERVSISDNNGVDFSLLLPLFEEFKD